MRKTVFVLLALLATGLAVGALAPAQDAQPGNVSTFMRLKLRHSQDILEGLTTEDYDLITKNAQKLSLLSEETLWQVFQTPEYQHQSAEFRRACDDLTKAGKEKNLDGAALAYLNVTMKCIRCHEYVRDVRMVSVGGAPAQLGLNVQR